MRERERARDQAKVEAAPGRAARRWAHRAQIPQRTEATFMVSLVEVPKENWSFGLGEASYAKE